MTEFTALLLVVGFFLFIGLVIAWIKLPFVAGRIRDEVIGIRAQADASAALLSEMRDYLRLAERRDVIAAKYASSSAETTPKNSSSDPIRATSRQ